MGASYFTQRTAALLLGVLAFLALALSAVGLYALVAFNVAAREQEIAVRVALGAASHDIVRLVVTEGAGAAGWGIAGGCALTRRRDAGAYLAPLRRQRARRADARLNRGRYCRYRAPFCLRARPRGRANRSDRRAARRVGWPASIIIQCFGRIAVSFRAFIRLLSSTPAHR